MQATRFALVAAAALSVAALVNIDAFARDGGRGSSSATSTSTTTSTRMEAKLRNATQRGVEGKAEYRIQGTRERAKFSVEHVDLLGIAAGATVTFTQAKAGAATTTAPTTLGTAIVGGIEFEAELEFDNLASQVVPILEVGDTITATVNGVTVATGVVKAK